MVGRSGSSMKSEPAAAVVIVAAVTAGLVAGVGGVISVLWFRQRGIKAAGEASGEGAVSHVARREGPASPVAGETSGVAPPGTLLPTRSWHVADVTPPLPDEVVRLLQSSQLCFLSTFSDDHPHLSLMNFTYYHADEVIILSTRRDTKKYQLVQTGRNVAILVHEFPNTGFSYSSSGGGGDGGGGQGKVTITLNGRATIQEGEQAERYREIHAQENPDSKTFIVGPNIAIITVRVRSARICNIRDEVTVWNVTDSKEEAK